MMSVLGELLEKSLIRRAALGSVQEPLYISLWGPCTPFGKRNPESSSPNTFLEIISMRADSIGGLGWVSRYLCPEPGALEDIKMDPRGGQGCRVASGDRRGDSKA